MNDIIDVCHQSLKNLVEVVNVQPDGFDVEIGDDLYTVRLDTFDCDEDDGGDGTTLDRKIKDLTAIEDHADILSACLDAMARDESIRDAVTDLTTDGDGKDCEAIFNVEGDGYYILKVR